MFIHSIDSIACFLDARPSTEDSMRLLLMKEIALDSKSRQISKIRFAPVLQSPVLAHFDLL